MRRETGDRTFFMLTIGAALAGFAIFASAALGLLARESASVSKDILVQAGLGLGLGLIGLFIMRAIPLAQVKKYSPHLFAASLLLTALVFVPGIGVHANGATRWIDLRFTTIQPAEFLKVGYVLVLAWWLAPRARQLQSFKSGLLPFMLICALPAALLLAQPNNSTTLLMLLTGAVMYFVAGAPLRDFAILALALIIGLGAIAYLRPYALQRIQTFVHPEQNTLSSGYQIGQSLIAVGSGQLAGRGLGQSVEKFNYLPEPDGDSVFAVFAEETGFIGSVLLLGLFLALVSRGIVIAGDSRDLYGGLIAVGFSFLIILQTFINICAMLGIIPLTGLPLPFVSHGGTALMVVLIECGLILNVAAHRRA